MKLKESGPVETDIVLLGAGHANVQVLRAFGMEPLPGIRLTIVTDKLQAPYSGMLPGCIAGDYTAEDIHIDIARLARHVGARLIHARAASIDPIKRHVHLQGRAPIAYDQLSINVGITPDIDQIKGAKEHSVPVKPISGILDRLELAQQAIRLLPRAARISVIGGGPAGIELVLALNDHNRKLSQFGVELTLIAGGGLAPSLNPSARRRAEHALRDAGISLVEGDHAVEIKTGFVICQSGRKIDCDVAFVSTNARLPDWLSQTDLKKAKNGGIAVRETLQLIEHDTIFAAGDCATMLNDPRPRAGVFAVRQGPVLAKNLFAAAKKETLKIYKPQKDYLTILRTGIDSAIASRGRYFSVEGRWVSRWKNHIDQAFMAMFRVADETPDPDDITMRCGGCAAKVGPAPLRYALSRLPGLPPNKDILVGLAAADDAAVIAWGKGSSLITSVDQFRSHVSDPYLFGQIAANHALNDIFAMGGTPHHALALAVLPFNPAQKIAEELYQLLAGARATLDAANTALIGGHSSEGDSLALGFSVTGRPGKTLLTKTGAKPGDHLILTKPIGTGIAFAADMRAMAPSATVENMIQSMLLSNGTAAQILVGSRARAMTDVSGFGLAGHLSEMLGSSLGAELQWSQIPLGKGVFELAEKGFTSSLFAENRRPFGKSLQPEHIGPVRSAILFDPQTAGGLLAAVPASSVSKCLRELHEAGYRQAKEIGFVTAGTDIILHS